MKIRSTITGMLLTIGAVTPDVARAQCCLTDLFAGCGTCFRKPPAYAVAPIVAPIPAPPPPVMVPVQQTSYVPETTYRTEFKTVPVTTYKPSCEIDPCTGCPRDCVQPITQYVQQAVNVPVTQYRAVTSTKYVQMQQTGPAAYGAYPAPMAVPGAPFVPAPAAPPAGVTSPFAAPINTTPQAWAAAGADVSNQLAPGQASINPPSLPAAPPTFQQQQRPIYPPAGSPVHVPPATVPAPPPVTYQPVPSYTQPYAPPSMPTQQPAAGQTMTQRPLPEATSPPPLKPIPRNDAAGESAPRRMEPPALQPSAPAAGAGRGDAATGNADAKASGASGAFPRLLDPRDHTTSWQPASLDGRPAIFHPAYPTAALPLRNQQ